MKYITEGLAEALYQRRVNEMKKRPLKNYLLLRANYEKDLHDAIVKGDMRAVKKWLNSQDEEDLEFYDDNMPSIKELQKEFDKDSKEMSNLHKRGEKMMGESADDLENTLMGKFRDLSSKDIKRLKEVDEGYDRANPRGFKRSRAYDDKLTDFCKRYMDEWLNLGKKLSWSRIYKDYENFFKEDFSEMSEEKQDYANTYIEIELESYDVDTESIRESCVFESVKPKKKPDQLRDEMSLRKKSEEKWTYEDAEKWEQFCLDADDYYIDADNTGAEVHKGNVCYRVRKLNNRAYKVQTFGTSFHTDNSKPKKEEIWEF